MTLHNCALISNILSEIIQSANGIYCLCIHAHYRGTCDAWSTFDEQSVLLICRVLELGRKVGARCIMTVKQPHSTFSMLTAHTLQVQGAEASMTHET